MMEQNKKQTAVEFVIEKLDKFIEPGNQIIVNIILEQAKEMEKEQIINAYERGDKYKTEISGKQYYKETYGKE